jgi:hypothetical protein
MGRDCSRSPATPLNGRVVVGHRDPTDTRRPIDPEVVANEVLDADGVELLKDPIYAARMKAWLGDPKKLLD